jgi:hypothetical protein
MLKNYIFFMLKCVASFSIEMYVLSFYDARKSSVRLKQSYEASAYPTKRGVITIVLTGGKK